MLAFTFPGQGSQRPGMGSAWSNEASYEIVTEASDLTGRDLGWLLTEATAEDLRRTENAQLATFLTSLVVLDAIERTGLSPTWCAGHSLGEYTALVAAGFLTLEDGLQLVSVRGQAMQEASEHRPGTMAALVGIDDAGADVACRRADDEVWVANYNAPGQVAIAGTAEAIAKATAIAKELGARKALALQVSGAFHTPLMIDAREPLRKALAEVSWCTSEVPVVANVDGLAHDDPSQWGALLSSQLTNPVRWHQSLSRLYDLGATSLVEVGPGGVLTGLARRALPQVSALSVSTPDNVVGLMEATAGNDWVQSHLEADRGEKLFVSERLIVSPCAGVFHPRPELNVPRPGDQLPSKRRVTHASPQGAAGRRTTTIGVGNDLGTVSGQAVRSPFEGELVGFLAHSGERVESGQPLAWMRAASRPDS